MSQNLFSAAVVIGALRVKGCYINDFKRQMLAFEMNKSIIINLILFVNTESYIKNSYIFRFNEYGEIVQLPND